MQRVRLDLARLEPVGDLLDVLAAGVIEVLACSKDFNGLSATAGQRIEQAGVQTLAEEDMGGEGSEHRWWVRGLFSHLGMDIQAARPCKLNTCVLLIVYIAVTGQFNFQPSNFTGP